ncbi:hypothetical protein BH23PLA1_BH23PLA1_23080 [soil metagenome]
MIDRPLCRPTCTIGRHKNTYIYMKCIVYSTVGLRRR